MVNTVVRPKVILVGAAFEDGPPPQIIEWGDVGVDVSLGGQIVSVVYSPQALWNLIFGDDTPLPNAIAAAVTRWDLAVDTAPVPLRPRALERVEVALLESVWTAIVYDFDERVTTWWNKLESAKPRKHSGGPGKVRSKAARKARKAHRK